MLSIERTPELSLDAVGADAGLTARTPSRSALPTYSMFRPIQHRKILVVIRHGESEFNAQARSSGSWREPSMLDPHLTARGCQQACALRTHLEREFAQNKHLLERVRSRDDVLWVASPLQRALQTLLLGCPSLPKFKLSADENHPRTFRDAHLQQQLDSAAAAVKSGLPKVHILSDIAEKLLTSGDIGTATSELKAMYKPLAECMDGLQEQWWFGDNVNACGRFERKEPEARFKGRVAAAKAFLEKRPEPVIVLVGHSVFWKDFFRMETSLKNCEYKVLHW